MVKDRVTRVLSPLLWLDSLAVHWVQPAQHRVNLAANYHINHWLYTGFPLYIFAHLFFLSDIQINWLTWLNALATMKTRAGSPCCRRCFANVSCPQPDELHSPVMCPVRYNLLWFCPTTASLVCRRGRWPCILPWRILVSFWIHARHVSQTPLMHYLYQILFHTQISPDFTVAFSFLQRYSTNLPKNGHFKDKQFLFAGFLQYPSFGTVQHNGQ